MTVLDSMDPDVATVVRCNCGHEKGTHHEAFADGDTLVMVTECRTINRLAHPCPCLEFVLAPHDQQPLAVRGLLELADLDLDAVEATLVRLARQSKGQRR